MSDEYLVSSKETNKYGGIGIERKKHWHRKKSK
jgi:hypothetical protein